MYESLRRRLLTILKVPAQPHSPAGDPASLQVFRAGLNYLRLRLAGWAVTQFLALAAIIFWTAILIDVEIMVREQQAPRAQLSTKIGSPVDPKPPTKNWPEKFADQIKSMAHAAETGGKAAKTTNQIDGWLAGYKQMLVEVALLLPGWAFPLIWGLKIFSIVIYLVQIPVTYAVRRLDYEMRWYMVTDRSLRLRHGVWKISESTMSFANIQQVVVSQNPLQRLLGLADVKVKSAGGGSHGHQQEKDDMHTGLFHSVTRAPEIRDLIIRRLRHFRESGLGDPDESARTHGAETIPTSSPSSAVAAARELLAEVKALRMTLE